MKNKTVIAILVAAGLLTTYIAFFERGRMTTTELDERKNRVFLDFRRGDVDALTLVSKDGQRTELKRVAAKVPGADPRWVVASAGDISADETEVRGVLAALDYLLVDRTVEGTGVGEDPRYGLDEPHLGGSFRVGDETTEFFVGGEAPGDKVYVAVSSRPERVFAVDADFAKAVDKTIAGLRSKQVVEGDLDRAVAVTVEKENDEISLNKEGGAWSVTSEGGSVLAAHDRVRELLMAIFELRAESFEADGEPGAIIAAEGLTKPWARVSVEMPGKEEIALRIGAACDGGEGRKAIREGSGAVVCIGPGLPALLEGKAADYWETTLVPADVEEVLGVVISEGDTRLSLEKSEEGRWSAKPQAPFPLGNEAVRELLELVSKTKAQAVHTGEDAEAAFGEKRGSLEIRTVAGVPDVTLKILAAGDGGPAGVRRGKEEIVLAVADTLFEKLSADPLLYRERSFEVCDPERVRRVEIDAEVDQVLEEREDGWWVVSPATMRADDGAVEMLVKALAEPKVQRWVRVETPGRLGLGKPAALGRVSIRCSKRGDGHAPGKDRDDTAAAGEEIAFLFGESAGADEEVYATVDLLGDDIAFVSRGVTRYLERPLVQRDLFQVAPNELASVVLEAGGRRVVVGRAGGTWVAEPGSGFDPGRFDRMLIDMSAMRIVKAVSYGERRPGGETTAQLAFESDKGPERQARFWIGPESDDPEDSGYLARRNDWPVTVIIPARIVDGLLESAGLR